MATPSQPERTSRPGVSVAACAALGIALLLLHARRYDFVADDTFIGLRYVRHLLSGEGLVYNVGEQVEGYTNFLWLLLIAIPGAAGIDLLDASRILGCACGAGTILVAVLACRTLLQGAGERWSLLPTAILLAASAPLACWTPSGMETPAYALLVTASVMLALRSDAPNRLRIITGIVLGLTALTRPEGILVGLIALTFLATTRGGLRKTLTLTGIPLALLFGGHLAFRLAYYGEWVPNTFHAKVGGPSSGQALRGLEYLHTFVMDNGGLLLYSAPLIAGFWRRDRGWWLVATTLLALTAGVIGVGGDGLPMYRFCVPLLPLWAILMGSLFHEGVRAVQAFAQQPAWMQRCSPWLVVLAVMAISEARPSPVSIQYLTYQAQKEREIPTWTAVGKWLRDNSEPGDSIACVPIGAVGYYSGLQLYDMLGLTDRHIAKLDVELGAGWAGHEKHDGPYILSRKPTFLLLGNIRVGKGRLPLDHPEFVQVNNPLIAAREGDIFTPELKNLYKPTIARISKTQYLHFLRRR